MTRIILSKDCQNSPKNLFIRDLTLAFAARDIPIILARVSDDIRWNRVGSGSTDGKPTMTAFLKRLNQDDVAEITIQHSFTHGKGGVVNGWMRLKNGFRLAFCDVYDFTSVKGDSIREITSYSIELD